MRRVPYRLNLTKLSKHELERLLEPKERTALTMPRLLRRPVLSSDEYPDALALEVAEEEHWDALGASLPHAIQAKSYRDAMLEMGFVQVNAYRLKGMPYHRNFFAYTKEADTFGAVYLSDAGGIPPYVEMFTLFRQLKDDKIGVITSSAALIELDPSPALNFVHFPEKHPDAVFQLHRSKILETGKANRAARTSEDFEKAYLEVWNANYTSWIERGVLTRGKS
jgi:hypothetical protein